MGYSLLFVPLAYFNLILLIGNKKLPNRVLYLNAFVNAAIVQTHLYGIFYSGAILFAFIARDKCSKIFRPKIHLSIVLSWISLIPYIPSFLNQADAGNPRSWIPIPDLQDLIQTFNPSSLILYMIVFTHSNFCLAIYLPK